MKNEGQGKPLCTCCGERPRAAKGLGKLRSKCWRCHAGQCAHAQAPVVSGPPPRVREEPEEFAEDLPRYSEDDEGRELTYTDDVEGF